MKRGELYPEVIGEVTRLRRRIACVYGVDMIQAYSNFSANCCIDSFLSYIQRLELAETLGESLNREGIQARFSGATDVVLRVCRPQKAGFFDPISWLARHNPR